MEVKLMRFSVTYSVDRIPIHYRMKVYSLIKEAIKRENDAYFSKVFLEGKRNIKPFSFATYLKDLKVNNDFIDLKEITITISANVEFAIYAFNGLRQIKTYNVSGFEWIQKDIKLLKEPTINSSKVLMKTLSPILIEDHTQTPLSPKDISYEKELNYYANLVVQIESHRDLHQPIKFTPINMKKVVIKESNRLFSQTHQDMSLYFTTYSGTFLLEGHPEDLQIIYLLGLGKRTTYFGLLEYVREEVS